MKKINSFLVTLGLLILGFVLASCNNKEEKVDYVSNLKLEQSYASKEFFADGIGEVELYTCIDGDTAYFLTNNEEVKIRFVSVDTPESTGKIEPWGKTASDYTKNILTNADTIVLQSSTGSKPSADSTGSRYLAFIWYKMTASDEFRNLNLELVQEGYSRNKAVDGALYQDIFGQAGTQAMKLALHVWSSENDPNYDYSNGQNVTLKEIAINPEPYLNKRVNFEAYVSRVYDSYCYLQNEVDGKTYGTVIYLGYDSTLTGTMSPFKAGNLVRVHGFVQQFNGNWQVAGCTFNAFHTDPEKYPQECQLISKGHDVQPVEITGAELNNGAEIMRTLVKLDNLVVTDTYVGDAMVGDVVAQEMTITCKTADGTSIQLRTGSLYKAYNDPLTEEDFKDATLTSVVGIVDNYEGTYQVRLVSYSDIVFQK